MRHAAPVAAAVLLTVAALGWSRSARSPAPAAAALVEDGHHRSHHSRGSGAYHSKSHSTTASDDVAQPTKFPTPSFFSAPTRSPSSTPQLYTPTAAPALASPSSSRRHSRGGETEASAAPSIVAAPDTPVECLRQLRSLGCTC